MKTIALATSSQWPNLTSEDKLLTQSLADYGYEARPVVWEKRINWQQFDAVVIRSCWDYHHKPGRFVDWLKHLERKNVAVLNPVSLIQWNMHKNYLDELAGLGIETVSTYWVEQGSKVSLRHILLENSWDKVVIKPAISASGHSTWVSNLKLSLVHQRDFQLAARQTDLMIQPFIETVKDGEWSFVFFGGRFHHAVLKCPVLGDFRVQTEFGGTCEPVRPGDDLIEQAHHVVEAIQAPWAFARVDGVLVDDQFQLFELELIEPQLFLEYEPDAPARLAEVIVSMVQRVDK